MSDLGPFVAGEDLQSGDTVRLDPSTGCIHRVTECEQHEWELVGCARRPRIDLTGVLPRARELAVFRCKRCGAMEAR